MGMMFMITQLIVTAQLLLSGPWTESEPPRGSQQSATLTAAAAATRCATSLSVDPTVTNRISNANEGAIADPGDHVSPHLCDTHL